MHVCICISPLYPSTWLLLEILSINSPPNVHPTCQKSSAIRRAFLPTFQITNLTSASPTLLSHLSLSLSNIVPIMAYKTRLSFFPLISVSVILLALVEGAVAGRNVPTTSDKDDKKQPQWLLGHDGSFLIPGIGRVMLPPMNHGSPFPGMGSTGSTGGSGSGGSPSGHDYVPGGDDTFVPNPGNEVPTPGNGGGSAPVAPNP